MNDRRLGRCANCAHLERRYAEQQERIRELEEELVKSANFSLEWNLKVGELETACAAMRAVLQHCYDLRFKLGWADPHILEEISAALEG